MATTLLAISQPDSVLHLLLMLSYTTAACSVSADLSCWSQDLLFCHCHAPDTAGPRTNIFTEALYGRRETVKQAHQVVPGMRAAGWPAQAAWTWQNAAGYKWYVICATGDARHGTVQLNIASCRPHLVATAMLTLVSVALPRCHKV